MRALVEERQPLTGSPRAAALLADWTTASPRMLKVIPAEPPAAAAAADPSLIRLGTR